MDTTPNLTNAEKERRAKFAQLSEIQMEKLDEINKLSFEIANVAPHVRKAYFELGKLYFAQFGKDVPYPFTRLCTKIAEDKERIDQLRERIHEAMASAELYEEDLSVLLIFDDTDTLYGAPEKYPEDYDPDL